jgi:membrane dipeptidase
LHREAPLIDGHNDLPWEIRKAGISPAAMRLDRGNSRVLTDIPRLRRGMVGGVFWSVYVPASLSGDAAARTTREQIDRVKQLVAAYPGTFEMAYTSDDVLRVFQKGKIASLIGMEGGHSINSSLATLRDMYARGARYMTLTHSRNVPWADSATDTARLKGLSAFGEQVIAEMNRLGMIVDLSHVSADTMRHAMRVTKSPVIFSHSNARAIRDHARNVPDDVLRTLKSNRGVIMVVFVRSFVSSSSVDVRRVADHIDHIRKVAGIDHVGIGSDFDGGGTLPGLEDVSKFPNLTIELIRRGYTDSEIKKVLGLNILRVMREVEEVARQLQGRKAA